MRKNSMMIAVLVATGALSLNAQVPQQPPQTPRTGGDTTQRAGAAMTDQVVVVTGCLKQEKDVPGLTPNPAERVGVTDDYILTDTKMAQSSTVSGLALSTLYEVEGIAEAELKKHLNHQVEITGRIGGAPTADDRTPNFNATSLKMISASCGAPK